MKTITENNFEVISNCETREIEVKLEGDAELNFYKSILIRFAEDGNNPIWIHESDKTKGVKFYYENLYALLREWGYDYDEITDHALDNL